MIKIIKVSGFEEKVEKLTLEEERRKLQSVSNLIFNQGGGK